MTSETVKVGTFSTHLWRASDGRWKWHAYKGGKRVLCAAKDLHDARTRARDQLKAIRDGKADLAKLDDNMVSEFLAWRSSRRESPVIRKILPDYIASQRAAGLTDYYVDALEADLTAFAKAHGSQRFSDITPEHVGTYLGKLPVGPRRHNNIRGGLVSFFRWARNHGHLPDGLTAPERTQKRKEPRKAVAIYTPEQFCDILRAAPEEWRLALAIGGLAGIRTEEIMGLRWENLKPAKALIEIPAEICKTRRRRLVPICPALRAWIDISQPTEARMVAPNERLDNNCIRAIRKAGAKWIKNGLRHSYGSYRCAETKDVPAVAYEMGNSPAMVMRHYHEAQELSTALEWFATTPEKALGLKKKTPLRKKVA